MVFIKFKTLKTQTNNRVTRTKKPNSVQVKIFIQTLFYFTQISDLTQENSNKELNLNPNFGLTSQIDEKLEPKIEQKIMQ